RRKHAHVHFARRALAERVHLALLKEAQELRLKSERQVANLVEEERAALSRAYESFVIRVRARERALAVAEQEALDEFRRRGGAVERDEGGLRAATQTMDCARDQLLARARLARDEHGRVGVFNPLDRVCERGHRA